MTFLRALATPLSKEHTPQIGSFAPPSLRLGLPFTDHALSVGRARMKSMNVGNPKRSVALGRETGLEMCNEKQETRQNPVFTLYFILAVMPEQCAATPV